MQPGIARRFVAPTAALVSLAPAWGGVVNVSFSPDAETVQVGQTVEVRIQLSSTTPAAVAAAEILFAWDPTELRLTGLDHAGAANLLTSGLPRPDPFGLNEAALPADGTAYYLALARLGRPLPVSEEGETILLTTLLFEALTPTQAAEISIVATAGSPPGHTRIFDGVTPNTDITGALSGAVVTIIPAPAAGAIALLATATLTRRRPCA